MNFLFKNIEPLIVILVPLFIFLKFKIIHSFLVNKNIISLSNPNKLKYTRNYVFCILLILVAIYFDSRWFYYHQNSDTILLYAIYYVGVIFIEIFFEGADRVLFPYAILLIYLLISASALSGSYKHTNKDGSRDRRYKNNEYAHSYSQKTRALYEELGSITLVSLVGFLIIDAIFL